MAKEFKVFFSWQSDLSANQTRNFIEKSIEMAASLLPDSILLVPDEATRNRFGSPDIVNSIFEKIDKCDLFIADVSVVGHYSLPTADSDEPETKYLPNPNVLLELGYAAARISWDRCICLANSKFGAFSLLPFDLNHRRITDYSYEGSTRKKKLSEIAEIIKDTVIEYADKPIPRSDFSYHTIGGFNFDNGNIEARIIPYNDTTIAQYCRKTEAIIRKASTIVERIAHIRLPDAVATAEENDFDMLAKNKTVGEILRDPVLSKKYMQKMANPRPVRIDQRFFCDRAKRHLDIELNDDFFYLGNLKETTPLFSNNSIVFEGSDDEKYKYSLISELRHILLCLELREMFKNMFSDIVIVPLAIKNASTRNDERISITLKVTSGDPIIPSAQFFNPDYSGLEGHVYDEALIEELLALPESGMIKHDSSLTQDTPYDTHFEMPLHELFEQASSAEDYEAQLQEYVQTIDDGTPNEFSFFIGALRPNETVWLDRVLLIKPVNGEIVIDYSIKSNNSTGFISGKLVYNHENQ